MPSQVVWMTGLSGAGKTTLCHSVENELKSLGIRAILLDGDVLRAGLCSDLGFSTRDRIESVRRIAHTAKLFADSGVLVLVAVMAPIEAARNLARSIIPDLIQVFVDAPLEICERRDVKGLYARARRGEIEGFTGIDAPFEPPSDSHIICHSGRESVEVCSQQILDVLGITKEKTTVPSPLTTTVESRIRRVGRSGYSAAIETLRNHS